MKTFLFVFLLVIISSCHTETGDYIPVRSLDLSSCEKIVYQEIVVKDYLLSYPTGIFLIDGKLVIKDEKGYRKLFHVITKDGELVQEFLQSGEGPEEYVSSNFNSQLSNDCILDMFDSSRKKNISFKYKEGYFSFSSMLTAKTNEENIRELVNCGNYYLATGVNGRFVDNRFLVLDTLGNVKTAIGNYPEILPDLLVKPEEDMQTILFNTALFRRSPDKQKAVFASYKGALLEFLDLSALPDSVPVKSVQLARPKKKEQITREHEGWVYGFEDVYVTNKNVYVIYNGETAVDNPELGRYILKYNWDGNLLHQYKFDMGLRSLAVDEATGTIFFVGYVNDEMKLFFGNL